MNDETPIKVYPIIAYVETEEWREGLILGTFRDAGSARMAFDTWVTDGGPNKLDPTGRMWDDGYSDYGYCLYECELGDEYELGRHTTDDAVLERKRFARVWPEGDDGA